MSDRSVTYTFKGNFTNLGAGLTAMGKGVGDLGTKLTALDRQGATARRGLTQLGSTAGKIGLAAAAGFAAIVVSAANFDQAMSRVKAATRASGDEMESLRVAAIKAGQDTVFSATEAADAITALAKAGVSSGDILAGGLSGSLALASAGELDVAQAAEIAATAMNQFGLQGKDVGHIADLLASAANSAQGEVTDMANSLKYVGPVAHQMGISIEETTGAIAELASQGILGEQAGTSLRGMLTALTSPSLQAKKQMQALGIQLYDTTGQFVGFKGVADQLQKTMGGLTEAERNQALGRIFGNEQITAARVLYAGGAADVDKWTKAVDQNGAAADIAAIKMDNLRGDLEQLRGSLETALIGAGSGSQGPLRSLTQDATGAVNAFNKLSPSMQSSLTVMLGITAVTGGGLWFGSKVINGVARTKQALDDLGGKSGPRAERALRGVAIAGAALVSLEIAGGIIDRLDKSVEKAAPNVEKLKSSLIGVGDAKFAEQFGNLKQSLDDLDPSGLDGIRSSINDIADKGGLAGRALETGLASFAGGPGSTGLDEVRHQADEATAAFEALDQALAGIATSGGPDQARAAFDKLAQSQGLSGDQQKQLLALLPQYQDALQGAANDATLAAGATDQMTGSISGVGGSADDAAQHLTDMVKAMQDERSAAVDAFSATTAYRQALKDAAKQAKASNDGINGNSDAALKNRDVLASLAAAWNAQDQTVTDNIAKFKEAKANFIATAEAMKVPKTAAKELANTLLEIPESKVIPVTTPGVDQATDKARTLKDILDQLHSKDINIALHYQMLGNKPPATTPGNPNGRFAAGRTTGLNITVPTPVGRTSGDKAGAVASSMGLLAKNSHDAAEGAKGLKERLHDAEKRLERLSKAADDAHSALDTLRSSRADLAASVTGSLSHDPFTGSLSDFEAQTAADMADAQAVLAALRTLIQNGLDPHSLLFQRLAASGNVSLIQQFAALTASQLAAENAAFQSGQSSLNQVGQFAGSQAFNDLIAAQSKVVHHLDDTVRNLTHTVAELQREIQHMGKHVHDGARDGTREGQQQANSGRDGRVAAMAQTQGRPLTRSTR